MGLQSPERILLAVLLQTTDGVFPLRSPINSPLAQPSAGQLFPGCCITIYGYEGKRANSCLFAVLVLLKKNNNPIVLRRITCVPLSLPLEDFKAEK